MLAQACGSLFIARKVYHTVHNHNLTCHQVAELSARVESILTIIRSSIYQRKQTRVTRVNYLQ